MPVCSLCKKDNDNPIDYGEFMKMKRSNICVHYYCLLLSTNLPQKGSDKSGILGFLLNDIRKEIKSSVERTCCYCKQPHASVECFKCKVYFHNICGNENGCVSEFINEFHSYCHKHVPFGNEKMLPQQNSTTCWICHELLGEFSPTQTLRSYCCKNGYVHRYCLRKYALSAGYYLMCIWCTDKAFRDDIRKHGVFVPDRDAKWENNESLRYTDLHRGYSQCDAKDCKCPQGRKYFRGPWKLVVCCMCGASGIHGKCGRGQIVNDNYTCEECKEILTQNANTSNYTMFISKGKNADAEIEIESSAPSDEHKIVEEEKSAQSTSKGFKKPQARKQPTILPSQNSQKKPQMREMFVFGKNNEIVGTALVPLDKLEQKPDKSFVCKEEDLHEFSCSDKLMKSIFADIVAEGRQLSEDMVDEVFERYKLLLENFGDCED